MPAQNIIELGFNVDELADQQKQVLNLMVDLFGKLKEYDGTTFNPLGSGGLADLKKSMTDSAAAMDAFKAKATEFNKVISDQSEKQQQAKKSTDETTLAVQAYNKMLDQTAQTQAKSNALSSNAAENLAIEKEQLKQRNAELQNSVKFLLAETGSVVEAKAAVAQLTAERDKQNVSTIEGKARLDELNEAINKNNDFIKLNSDKLGQQKINIGNYNGAVVTLEAGLNNISAKMEQMVAAGDQTSEAFQKLTLEQQVLKVLLDKQTAGFSSVTQEIRATKNALDTLTVAGLDNSETFNKLNTVYEQSKQKVNELHNEQKILTDANPALAALTASARGLGGAYALGAGASALFAEGNEKVEKELNKLVAIMTFLQGLEEAVRALRERGAIATALEATATKALSAAKQIEVALFGSSETVIKGETIAKTVNTEVTEANASASEAEAAGKVLSTEASEGLTIANVAATASSVGLRTALISTGIGAIIIGVVYAITKLVGAIIDWANADEKAEEKQKALAESSKDLIDLSEKLNDAYEQGSKNRLDSLEKENDKTKAAGQNQFIQLANERAIAQQRQQNAKEQLAFMDLEGGALDALAERRIESLSKVEAITTAINNADAHGDKSDVDKLTKKKDAANAEFNVLDDQYTKGLAATKEYNDATADIEDNSIKQSRAAAEQLAKITEDAANRRYETEKAANDRILSLDTSTEAQRLAAVKSNYSAEVALAGAQIEAIQKQVSDKVLTEADGADKIANIQNQINIKYKASLDEQVKIKQDYNDRLLEAQNGISKNNNESDAAVQEGITKDIQQGLDDRLTALKKNIADKTSIIVDDYHTQLTLALEHGKTEDEMRLLASNKDKELVQLTADTQKQIYDITISYGERRLKAIEDMNKATNGSNVVTENYNAQTDALNQQLINQTISYTKYINEKTALDRGYAIKKDQADIADNEKRLQQTRDFLTNEVNIQLEFASKELDRAKTGGNDKEVADAQAKYDALKSIWIKAHGEELADEIKLEESKQKLNKDTIVATLQGEATLAEREKELAEQSVNLAQTLVDATYENKINAIQKTIDATDQQADAEVSAVSRSTLSQRDQAAEIIIIEAQQKARDTQRKQEQKQEKIKEAEFDRDVALAKVAWSTAQAVMKDTADVPWPLSLEVAAVDVALGAVQAALILAKPIPNYGKGVENHPGGFALTGELYKPEMITMPGHDPFIVDTPTLLDMPSGSSVLPLDMDNMIFDVGGRAMQRGMHMINTWPDNSSWKIVEALNNQTGRFERALKKSLRKIQNSIHIHMQDDSEWIQTKIIGRR